MLIVQITEQSPHDLMVMESLAIPLSFVVLIWVFGGVLAALTPIAVGGMAILGALAVLRGVTFFTDVSIFALNLSAAMGLALAVDYTLSILSRYRDEIADGVPREEALVKTMGTAGRTVLFSATIVALSMAMMALFPMHLLKSFAYAGVATVGFAAAAALFVTPAVIVLHGDRLNAWKIRGPFRRSTAAHRSVGQPFLYRWTKGVMRHEVPGPGGRGVLLTGTAQTNADSVDAITSRLPLVLGLIAAIMFVVLFLLTGSVAIPLKALVLNALSLTAAFGAMVGIFQDGHLGGFGTTTTGTLVANIPVLLFCIAFGLSMDYEVFLVSRIR